MGSLLCCFSKHEHARAANKKKRVSVKLSNGQGRLRLPMPSSTDQLSLLGDLAIQEEQQQKEGTGHQQDFGRAIQLNERQYVASDPLDIYVATPTLNELCLHCSRNSVCFKARKKLHRQKLFHFDDSPLNDRWFSGVKQQYLGKHLTLQLKELVRAYREESDALLHETVAASLGRSAQFEKYLSTWCREYLVD